ncbi:siderophore biosynthesis protein [Enterovibrio sp. ZSDZ42]|uniref:Siderophore biosynthesis protein n=1 Tax=Enterovibrio gelatinilyticus TaxID=2899819 RepID=A0ABT5R6U5_9GAMM|nr:IucA/IucC family protein [Enterovibrio sp. ZSDZ42]MDD1795976.1 siderophore biosynthesis protein [Enterovibrio sp. ZSDZ42]
MSQNAKVIAEIASFQAFFNCYLKEIDEGHWYTAKQWQDAENNISFENGAWVVETPLPNQSTKLAIVVSYRTLVGCHQFSCAYLFNSLSGDWQEVPFSSAVRLLIDTIFSSNIFSTFNIQRETNKQELLSRVTESRSLMEAYIARRLGDTKLASTDFIDAEQSLLYGHWQHPTPKSRQGMLDYHHAYYAPETKGSFALHYFSIARDLICQRSALTISAEEIITSSLPISSLIKDDHLVLPMHPLQAQWLLHQPNVRQLMEDGLVVDLGIQGVEFTATSSVRSLYNAHLSWMYKFSLPVKITNSLRVNKRHELDAGVVMAALYRKTRFSEAYPQFKIITDPAYITVVLPGQSETGFEVIIRENPFSEGRDTNVVTIAALTQEALLDDISMLSRFVKAIALRETSSLSQVSIKWFAKYWECSIEPMLKLYDEHGIALEAHQQNSVLHIEDGYPSIYYFRDNQGFYLSNAYRNHLAAMDPESVTVDDLYFDDDVICDRFAYYLLINNLFSIIGRMGADSLVDERILISFVQQRLLALRRVFTGAGTLFVDQLLSQSNIPAKGNLLTRVHDVDELTVENEQAIYCQIPNPLVMTCLEEATEVCYASA